LLSSHYDQAVLAATVCVCLLQVKGDFDFRCSNGLGGRVLSKKPCR